MAEYLELEKVLDDRNIITVQTKEYGNIDVIPVDTITDIPLADVQPVNQWISVKDRLPENCIEVLVYDTDCGIVIGWYDKEIGDFAADFISLLDAVTHWMPLPEPPKDGEQNA